MAGTAAHRKKQKSEDQILDEATMSLLQAVKQHVKAKGKVISSEKLRKEGYSERFVSKVERA